MNVTQHSCFCHFDCNASSFSILLPCIFFVCSSWSGGYSSHKSTGTSFYLQELTPSWVKICGGTYLFSEDQKSWYCFERIVHHFIVTRPSFILIYAFQILKSFREDAYGECELYGSHIAQVSSFVQKNISAIGIVSPDLTKTFI